jgi:hypothetical protein
VKDSFCKELEHVFNKSPTYHIPYENLTR